MGIGSVELSREKEVRREDDCGQLRVWCFLDVEKVQKIGTILRVENPRESPTALKPSQPCNRCHCSSVTQGDHTRYVSPKTQSS